MHAVRAEEEEVVDTDSTSREATVAHTATPSTGLAARLALEEQEEQEQEGASAAERQDPG